MGDAEAYREHQRAQDHEDERYLDELADEVSALSLRDLRAFAGYLSPATLAYLKEAANG